MKRLLMGIATVAIMATAASAQNPFADVPRDHWSYEAVNTLAQRGIVIGYPDGTFGGKRAMTRYEFATAVARMIPQFEQSIKDQIAAIPSTTNTLGPNMSDYAKTSDLGAFVTKDDFDALKKLVDQFAPELQMLQVDVAGLRKDLGALTDRVTTIEKELERIKITGESQVFAKLSATNRSSLRNGAAGVPVDKDGRPLNRTSNLLEASQIVYNTQLNIKAKVSKDVTAITDLNIGNFTGAYAAATAQSGTPGSNGGGFPYGNTGRGSLNAEISPLKAYISAPLNLKLLGNIDLEAGKTGVQFTPYTLKLVDYDTYTNIPFTDNGEVVFTGAKGVFNIGGIALTAYAGTHGTALLNGYASGAGYPVLFTGGTYSPDKPFAYSGTTPIMTMADALFGQLPSLHVAATQSAGLRAVLGTPLGGTLGLTYLNAGINGDDSRFNIHPAVGVDSKDVGRASVYGADLALTLLRGIGVQAEYANSNMFERGTKYSVNSDNSVLQGGHEAIDAKLAFNVRTIALTAGYKKVDPFFGAPGSWGAIGGWKNPVNIKGYVGTIGVPLFKGLEFSGSAAQYKSIIAGVGGAPLKHDDGTKITHLTAGLKLNLGTTSNVDLGVENVRTKANTLINPGDNTAQQTYYNFGYGTALSTNSSFRLLYQIIDYRDKGANLLNNGQDVKGSVAVGQFTVKF